MLAGDHVFVGKTIVEVCSMHVAAISAAATVVLAFGFPSPTMPRADRLILAVAGVFGGLAIFYLARLVRRPRVK